MTDYSKPARVRVAPSPTGHMHLATARTALYDYLLARKTGGQFILRVEDTDLKRTVPGSEQEIMDGLHLDVKRRHRVGRCSDPGTERQQPAVPTDKQLDGVIAWVRG